MNLEKVKVCHEDDNITLQIEESSFTKDFDIQKETKTFYDLSVPNQQVIKTALSSYGEKDFIDYSTKGVAIPHVLVQYEEMDWKILPV